MSIAAGLHPSSFGPVTKWAVRVLSIVALGISLYLAWHTVSGSAVAGCTGDGSAFDCDHVLASPWSRWLGVPVALPAVICYAMIFAASWFVAASDERLRTVATRLILLLAVIAGGSAIWFTGLQFIAIGKICPYCIAVHSIGLILAGLVLAAVLTNQHQVPMSRHQISSLRATLAPSATAPRVEAPLSWSARHGAGLTIAGGLAVLLVLVAGQVLFPGKSYVVETVSLSGALQFDPNAGEEQEPETPVKPENPAEPAEAESKPEVHVAQRIPTEVPDESETLQAVAEIPEEETPAAETESANDDAADSEQGPREITLLDGKLKFDIYQHAVLGSREAPYVIIEMMDYTCPHCRKMGRRIRDTKPRFGDQLAVVIMPVPLDASCNSHMPRTAPDHRYACKFAQLGQAVMALNPKKFEAIHHFLLASLAVPTLDEALVHAHELVPSNRLRETMHNDEIAKRIQQYIELYVRLKDKKKDFGLPVQILGDEVITGPIGTDGELEALWTEKLGIKPIE